MNIARNKVVQYPALMDLFESFDADYRQRPHFFSEEATLNA
jgi:hypothetical protein